MNARLTSLRTCALFVAGSLSLGACSLVIQPDERRLGADGSTADRTMVVVDRPNVVPDGGGDRDVVDIDQVVVPDVPQPDVVVPVDVADVMSPDVRSNCVAGCNDGVGCTDDRCNEMLGTCVFTPNAMNCAMGQVCNPAMGGCIIQNCMNNQQCSDNNMCNGAEMCVMGVCQPGAALVCNDNNMCNGTESCDPARGCQMGVALNCNNGRYCDGIETCDNARGCLPGPAIPCSDGIACTTDSCNEDQDRCDNIPNPMACPMGQTCSIPMRGCVMQGCQNAAQCSDNNVCNGIEVCNAGVCSPGPALNCNDNNLCNGTETCDRMMGCQMGVPLVCDDRQFCNGVETCSAAMGCQRGAPAVCNDNNPCTNDSCNNMANGGAGGCVSTLVDADGDGAPARMVNGVACPLGTDCNDAVAAIRPGAVEVCNNVDDNCNGMTDEGLMCMGPPANDLCVNATPINLTPQALMATVNGTTLLATDNVQLACSPQLGGADVFYLINYPSGYDLRVEATPNGGGDPMIGVRFDCGGATLACNDDQRQGNVGPRVWIRDDGRAAPGPRRAYIIVDAYQNNTAGPFILTATLTMAAPYGSCRASDFDMSRGGTVLANPPPMTGVQSASCAPGGAGFLLAGEDAYSYNGANNGARVTLNATFRPLLSLRDSGMCMNPAAERNCATAGGPGQVSISSNANASAILVDGIPQPGLNPPMGWYSLEVRPN